MHRYSLSQTVAPAARCVSVDELKLQCGHATTVQLDADEEAVLVSLIDRATLYVEQETSRQLITATFVQRRTRFPTGTSPMLLGRSPLGAVSSITYYDDASTPAQQTWADTNYRVVSREPPAIYLGWQDDYPAMTALEDGIEITFTAGYGTASTDVPELLRQAVLLAAAHWYEYRTAASPMESKQLQFGLDAILNKYRAGDEFDVLAR